MDILAGDFCCFNLAAINENVILQKQPFKCLGRDDENGQANHRSYCECRGSPALPAPIAPHSNDDETDRDNSKEKSYN